MRRGCIIAVAVFLAINLWAGDPWRKKSYKVWNENDVRKILNESPWAKRIEVEGGPITRTGLAAAEEGATSEGDAGEEAAGGGGRGEDNERRESGKFNLPPSSGETYEKAPIPHACCANNS